jgi:hypothetical protein
MKVVKATLIAAVVGLITTLPAAHASSQRAPGKVNLSVRSRAQHRVSGDPSPAAVR